MTDFKDSRRGCNNCSHVGKCIIPDSACGPWITLVRSKGRCLPLCWCVAFLSQPANGLWNLSSNSWPCSQNMIKLLTSSITSWANCHRLPREKLHPSILSLVESASRLCLFPPAGIHTMYWKASAGHFLALSIIFQRLGMANARVIRIIEKEKDLTSNGQKAAATLYFVWRPTTSTKKGMKKCTLVPFSGSECFFY